MTLREEGIGLGVGKQFKYLNCRVRILDLTVSNLEKENHSCKVGTSLTRSAD